MGESVIKSISNNSKFLVVVLCMFIFGPIYFKLSNVNILFEEMSLFAVGIYLVVSVLLVYTIYVITFFIELLFLVTFRLIKIKYLIIYPFSYDGKLYFKPIKLLMHQDFFRDAFPMNLVIDLQNGETENQLKSKFKKIIYLREISTLISYGLVLLLIMHFFEISFLLEFTISFFSMILVSFVSDGYWWSGTRYIIKNETITKYLLSMPNLEEVDVEKYSKYLEEELNNKNKVIDVTYIDVLENCLYSSFYEEKVYLSEESLKNLCDSILHKGVELKIKSLRYEQQRISIQKMIGLISIIKKNNDYHNVFISLINKSLHNLSSINYFNVNTKNIESINKYIDFTNGNITSVDCKKHFIIDFKDIFSYRKLIEKEMKKVCKNRSKE